MIASPSAQGHRILAGRYRLRELLACGGTATVHGATDRVLDRPVAIKRLHPHLAGSHAAEALRAEAHVLTRIAGSHVVACFDAGADDGVPYLVLERLPGPDLAALSGSNGIASIEDGMRFSISLCQSIESLHGRGIVHGDLKPQHAMLGHDGHPVLIDPGIAASEPATAGLVIGTAAYLAPEVRAGAPPSVRSDLYALGAILYRLFTGSPPFASLDADAMARAHAYARPLPVRSRRPAVPARVDAIVARLLAKEPADRPTCAAVVRQALAGDHR